VETDDLVACRDELFEDLSDRLRKDSSVLGLAMIGSFGRNGQDEWSDLDLLVAVDDATMELWRESNHELWRSADLHFDAGQNAPRGGSSCSTIFVRSGLPFLVDWQLARGSLVQWPADCRLVYQKQPFTQSALSFNQLLDRSGHQQGLPWSEHRQRLVALYMIPVAAKHLARRSADATTLVELALGTTQGPTVPTDQIDRLRLRAAELCTRSQRTLEVAIGSYLNLVASSL
jgi:hypothetical protein